MGGYMGLGLQKWIYRQRPRRPFSKDRKPTGDTISQKRWEFKLRKHKIFTGDNLKIAFSLVLLITCAILIRNGIKNATKYTQEQNAKITETVNHIDEKAFSFLFESARQYSFQGKWEKAKKEYELALKIKPNDLITNKYYIQTLIVLCDKKHSNCDFEKEHVNEMIQLYSKDSELYKLKAKMLLLSGDTVNATLEMEKSNNMAFDSLT
jgi:tetratricopeptide (TPR) repeat protein